MNVNMISSLNTYTKNMKMQMKWRERQSSGNYTSKGTSFGKGSTSSAKEVSSAEELLKEQGALPGMPEKTDSNIKSRIQTKMMSGKRLTSEEMDYLKENDPQTYQKAKAIEMEREAYERELKQCKTKEEVQRLKLSHAASCMASVRNIEGDSSIPKGAKLGLMMQELQRANALGDTERAFMQSGSYKSLPTEAERKEAEEELAKAEKAERGIDDRTDDTPKEVTDSRNEDAVSASAEETAETEEREVPETELKAAKEVISGRKKSRMEAEVTPEARKVRRAKAQAAYAQTSFTGSSAPAVNIRIE